MSTTTQQVSNPAQSGLPIGGLTLDDVDQLFWEARAPAGPQFDCAVARDFLNLRYQPEEPAALVLGFTEGVFIPPGGPRRFDAVLAQAEHERTHLFFHVATLKPEWANPSTHAKGKITTATKTHVLECPFGWLDCDATKYTGADRTEAAEHYKNESDRVSNILNERLAILGVAPLAGWGSGGGRQALVKLDVPPPPEEAEDLVGRLHIALGFDPVVRNCNRILRVPGSINWKGRAS